MYSRTRATCILTGQPITLPLDLDKIAVRLDLKLPDRHELQSMLQGLLQSLGPRFALSSTFHHTRARVSSVPDQ